MVSEYQSNRDENIRKVSTESEPLEKSFILTSQRAFDIYGIGAVDTGTDRRGARN